MLKDISQIKISGRCEVFDEGCITFIPLGRDKVTIQVDNLENFLIDADSQPIPPFKTEVDAKQLSLFIENWILLKHST